MTDIKYGMTPWDEPEFTTGGGFANERSTFLRLESGSNIVRCITEPHQYYQHSYKEPNDPGFGDRVMCSRPAGGACPLCEKGDRPKRRWYVGVISRSSGATRIMDIGSALFQSIQTLSRDDAWGNPLMYDINIKVNKQGGASGYYHVSPRPKEPLSPADLELKAKYDLDGLKRLCSPPTMEKVMERLNSIKSRKLKQAGKTEETTNVSSVDSGDDDVKDFPDANATA